MEVRPIDANALLEKIRLREGPVMGQREIFLIEGEPTLSLNTLRDAIYQDAVEHGLWKEKECPSNCAWAIQEEAQELYDAGNDWEDSGCYRNEADPDFSEELADVVIMCFSVAGKLGIDIDAAIRRKMEINKGRAWKHGKERSVHGEIDP